MTSELRMPATIGEIDASPKGKKVGAFFDLDGTLIAGYSARYLAQDRMRRRELGLSEIVRSMALMIGSGVTEESFEQLLDDRRRSMGRAPGGRPRGDGPTDLPA